MNWMTVAQLHQMRIKTRNPFPKRQKKCIRGLTFNFRSSWEAKVATYLEMLMTDLKIRNWEYEPQTFWFEEIKRGTRSYLPDFKVTRTDGTHYWIEVKGYMDSKSATKLKRFKKYYPEEELILFDKEWFAKNGNKIPEDPCGTKSEIV